MKNENKTLLALLVLAVALLVWRGLGPLVSSQSAPAQEPSEGKSAVEQDYPTAVR